MKCPKCGYLGFKHVERCPNCGYDFSLSASSALLDLSIRPGIPHTPQPLADLALVDASLDMAPPPPPPPGATPDLGAVRPDVAVAPTPELPLFGSSADDTPLIVRPSPPRTPLAVRRATPELPRLRAEGRPAMLDLASSESEARVASPPPSSVRRHTPVPEPGPEPIADAQAPAGVAARVLAATIDVSLLAAIDVAIVYFTMQIVGVTLTELTMVPRIPLLAFLIVQNVSYFVLFTAGGQTMGQMACGIKVITDESGVSPDLSSAMLRTVVWTILAVPAGLGLTTTLFTADHRGLHDRFSGTRVVRASA
jgi:uncharacterized RDD family membrane protein YckC